MLVPLYGFLEGDTLGVVLLVDDRDTIEHVAATLQRATAMRVAPRDNVTVLARGKPLDPRTTVAAAGLTMFDRIDVVAAEAP